MNTPYSIRLILTLASGEVARGTWEGRDYVHATKMAADWAKRHGEKIVKMESPDPAPTK